MGICIYGEIALDFLVSEKGSISSRMGGAGGLYAALSAARLGGEKVDFLTLVGPQVEEYSLSIWNQIGVSFKHAKIDKNYVHPNYLVTGFENYRKKVSIPMTSIKHDIRYFPDLPTDSDAILIFPIGHSLPRKLCIAAKNEDKILFLDPKPNEKSIEDTRGGC